MTWYGFAEMDTMADRELREAGCPYEYPGDETPEADEWIRRLAGGTGGWRRRNGEGDAT